MRPYIVLAAALLATAGCEKAAESAAGESVLIRKVTLVSPERDGAPPVMDVLVRDGRIAEIAPDIAAEAESVIDGEGKFLTPGLIDGHVHLGSPPGMTYEQEQANPGVAKAIMAQMPKSYLFYGFTTVVDLNSGPQPMEAWNRQDVRPQGYFCGGAPIIDGYPSRFIPQSVRYEIMPYFLVEAGAAPEGIDAEKHSPAFIAQQMKDIGAICIKTFYEDGFGARNDWPTPSTALIRELVAQAHAHGLPVLLHANALASQRFGVEAGVDAFVHGMWTWSETDWQETAITPDVAAVLDDAIAGGVATQPTVQVLYGERDLHDPDYLKREAMRDALPQEALDWHRSEDGQSIRVAAASSEYMQEFLATEGWEALDAEAIARVTAATRYLLDHDGKLLFGSDTPSDLTFANPPGLNGRMEMDRWMAAGATPAQFLRAATLDNAQFFNLDNEIGTIEQGKRADLLLLGENPLDSVEAFDSIEMVIVNGKVLPRETLSARNQ